MGHPCWWPGSPGIGFDVSDGRDLQLGFVKLAVFIQFNESFKLFVAIFVLNFNVKSP